MSAAGLDIPQGHHRRVWVFTVDLSGDRLEAFNRETYDDDGNLTSWPLAQALGLSQTPDHDFIELFEAETLQEYSLARYLTDANGMSADDVLPDAERLNALTGPVLLVFSQALSDGKDSFAPSAPLRFVGSYALATTEMPLNNLTAESAKGILAQGTAPKRSDARNRGMGAMIALLILAVAVLLMLWVA